MTKERTFRFKHFEVRHVVSAMKVGTDGVLVGAWAPVEGAARVLDVGAGSGLISLMIAQRAPMAHVEGVEIDPAAAAECLANFAESAWADRLSVRCADIVREGAHGPYDLIVSNPPFFVAGEVASGTRGTARHEGVLTVEWLLDFAKEALTDSGLLAFIAPADRESEIDYHAAMAGLCPQRITDVVTVPGKMPKRQLWLVGRRMRPTQRDTLYIRSADGDYSPEFKELCRDFYLAF